MHGVRGAGVSPAEVDHQVQLPRPAAALREKHHTAGKKTFRLGARMDISHIPFIFFTTEDTHVGPF